MDIAPNEYYDIIITTKTTKNWIFHQVDIMTLTPQLALGWGALHIVGTMGGGVLTWMLECTKNPL